MSCPRQMDPVAEMLFRSVGSPPLTPLSPPMVHARAKCTLSAHTHMQGGLQHTCEAHMRRMRGRDHSCKVHVDVGLRA